MSFAAKCTCRKSISGICVPSVCEKNPLIGNDMINEPNHSDEEIKYIAIQLFKEYWCVISGLSIEEVNYRFEQDLYKVDKHLNSYAFKAKNVAINVAKEKYNLSESILKNYNSFIFDKSFILRQMNLWKAVKNELTKL